MGSWSRIVMNAGVSLLMTNKITSPNSEEVIFKIMNYLLK